MFQVQLCGKLQMGQYFQRCVVCVSSSMKSIPEGKMYKRWSHDTCKFLLCFYIWRWRVFYGMNPYPHLYKKHLLSWCIGANYSLGMGVDTKNKGELMFPFVNWTRICFCVRPCIHACICRQYLFEAQNFFEATECTDILKLCNVVYWYDLIPMYLNIWYTRISWYIEILVVLIALAPAPTHLSTCTCANAQWFAGQKICGFPVSETWRAIFLTLNAFILTIFFQTNYLKN